MTRTFGVVGTGMMGGSLALAARRAGWHVVGYDSDPAAAQRARALGVIDEALSRAELYDRAETVALAAHVDGTLDEIARIRAEPVRARLIFDIASVKAAIATASQGIDAFAATHPMAGTEMRGVEGAKATMFDGRVWAYVPGTSDEPMLALIAAFGATAVPIDPVRHDRTVALSSHLPQAIAVAFARRIAQRESSGEDPLLGPTARELLRLGSPNPAMWQAIFAHNASNVSAELRAMARALEAEADALA